MFLFGKWTREKQNPALKSGTRATRSFFFQQQKWCPKKFALQLDDLEARSRGRYITNPNEVLLNKVNLSKLP